MVQHEIEVKSQQGFNILLRLGGFLLSASILYFIVHLTLELSKVKIVDLPVVTALEVDFKKKPTELPQEIVEKMVDGRVRKYLAEISLTEQPFVKDSEKKVGDLCSSSGAKIIRFVRYEVGEGIDKDEDDFAAEVQRQLGD